MTFCWSDCLSINFAPEQLHLAETSHEFLGSSISERCQKIGISSEKSNNWKGTGGGGDDLWGDNKINIYCVSSYTYTVHNSAIGICEIKKPGNFNEIFKNVSAEIIFNLFKTWLLLRN